MTQPPNCGSNSPDCPIPGGRRLFARLALHFEKRVCDVGRALAYAEQALLLEEREDWRKRVERLRRKAATRPANPMLGGGFNS